MTIHPHPQHSEEWYESKKAKISGTRASILYNKSKSIFIKLLVEYTGDELREVYQNQSMQRGIELESHARLELNAYTGLDFKEVGFCFDESLPILGISPDGLTDDYKSMCEIKCFEAEQHMECCLTDEIPKENMPQCLHYFVVNPILKILYFASYRPEQGLKPLFVKKLTRESLVDVGLKETIEIKQFGKKGQPIKSKTKVQTKLITVQQAVENARKEAIIINQQLNEAVAKLKF